MRGVDIPQRLKALDSTSGGSRAGTSHYTTSKAARRTAGSGDGTVIRISITHASTSIIHQQARKSRTLHGPLSTRSMSSRQSSVRSNSESSNSGQRTTDWNPRVRDRRLGVLVLCIESAGLNFRVPGKMRLLSSDYIEPTASLRWQPVIPSLR